MTATCLKDLPILFNGPMVRAILAGIKTQTRRVVKENHLEGGPPEDYLLSLCPYGQRGDRLWVRETFKPISGGYAYNADTGINWCKKILEAKWKPSIHMPRWASRITLRNLGVRVEKLQSLTKADAIAEGLTALTSDGGQTIKYGIPDKNGVPGTDDDGWAWQDWCVNPIAAYARLWDSINAKRGYGWDTNPWVWAIEFDPVERHNVTP